MELHVYARSGRYSHTVTGSQALVGANAPTERSFALPAGARAQDYYLAPDGTLAPRRLVPAIVTEGAPGSGQSLVTWREAVTALVQWDSGERQSAALGALEALELASEIPARARVWVDDVDRYSDPVTVAVP